jgi:hypothetical protein
MKQTNMGVGGGGAKDPQKQPAPKSEPTKPAKKGK